MRGILQGKDFVDPGKLDFFEIEKQPRIDLKRDAPGFERPWQRFTERLSPDELAFAAIAKFDARTNRFAL